MMGGSIEDGGSGDELFMSCCRMGPLAGLGRGLRCWCPVGTEGVAAGGMENAGSSVTDVVANGGRTKR